MTNGGLSWRSAWGVLRYSANVAQLAMVHSTWAYDNGDAPYAAALFNYGQSQVGHHIIALLIAFHILSLHPLIA